CPAIADSSIGMGLSQARQKAPGTGTIDIIGDVVESANLIIQRPRTASVVLGGGTPKNFINQASVQAEFYCDEVAGHKYALQIVTDVPHFGGASGSSLEEAQSWGKLSVESDKVSVQADATIALPMLVSALATSAGTLTSKRKKPVFDMKKQPMTIDGMPVRSDRFEER
ncbi:MAG TPA: deoxyhypusine synthase family protein, partial [Vicinamibacterales bacterium]